jgi:hypothetical protein
VPGIIAAFPRNVAGGGCDQNNTCFRYLFAKWLADLRALLRKGAGALVQEPVIWYLPSSPRMGSNGRLCSFVPRKAVFDRRSNTTAVSSLQNGVSLYTLSVVLL